MSKKVPLHDTARYSYIEHNMQKSHYYSTVEQGKSKRSTKEQQTLNIYTGPPSKKQTI